MRLVVATCSVAYSGRLSAHLPLATRVLMLKGDGSVLVHADSGSYKPLNWMNAPNTLTVSEGEWVVANSKGETLTITLHEVLMDSEHRLGEDPGLAKDGVEAHLQELLAALPHTIEDGLTLIRREHATAIGPVDLLCRDRNGMTVAVEVKRRGEIDGVEQLSRYLEYLNNDSSLTKEHGAVRGIFVAQVIKPQAKTLAATRGLDCVEVDYDALRGAKPDELTLF